MELLVAGAKVNDGANVSMLPRLPSSEYEVGDSVVGDTGEEPGLGELSLLSSCDESRVGMFAEGATVPALPWPPTTGDREGTIAEGVNVPELLPLPAPGGLVGVIAGGADVPTMPPPLPTIGAGVGVFAAGGSVPALLPLPSGSGVTTGGVVGSAGVAASGARVLETPGPVAELAAGEGSGVSVGEDGAFVAEAGATIGDGVVVCTAPGPTVAASVVHS